MSFPPTTRQHYGKVIERLVVVFGFIGKRTEELPFKRNAIIFHRLLDCIEVQKTDELMD